MRRVLLCIVVVGACVLAGLAAGASKPPPFAQLGNYRPVARMTLRDSTVLADVASTASGGAAFSSPSTSAVRDRAPALRILYSTDWAGPSQVFAADPSGRAPVAQVTFGREPSGCLYTQVACGYVQPVPSPDGRWVVYRNAGAARPSGYPDREGVGWLSRPDGSLARRLPGSLVSYGVEWTQWGKVSVAWTPDSRRVAYAAVDGVHVIDFPGFRHTLISDSSRARFLAWAPDGKGLAYRTGEKLTIWMGDWSRVSAHGALGGPEWPWDDFSGTIGWSRDGRWIAYRADGKVRIVGLSGRNEKTLGTGAWAHWSPRANRVAFVGGLGVMTFTPGARSARLVAPVVGTDLAWSPDGRSLALVADDGIAAIDAQTGKVRQLTRDRAFAPVWAPDATKIAYLSPKGQKTHDLRTVTLTGRVRTVVAAAGRFGGQTSSPAWSIVPAGTTLRSPSPVAGIYTGGPVSALAADGTRAAFVVCGDVFVTDRMLAPTHVAQPGETGCVLDSDRYNRVQAFALAGDRLLFQVTHTAMSYRWELMLAGLPAPGQIRRVDSGLSNIGHPIGTAAGSGPLPRLQRLSHGVQQLGGSIVQALTWRPVALAGATAVLPDGSLEPIARAPIEVNDDAPVQPIDVDRDHILTVRPRVDLSVWDATGRKSSYSSKSSRAAPRYRATIWSSAPTTGRCASTTRSPERSVDRSPTRGSSRTCPAGSPRRSSTTGCMSSASPAAPTGPRVRHVRPVQRPRARRRGRVASQAHRLRDPPGLLSVASYESPW